MPHNLASEIFVCPKETRRTSRERVHLLLNCSKLGDGKSQPDCREGTLASQKILLGQVWKKDGTDETYLITKLYSEVFTTYAVLLKIGGEERLRIKVQKSGDTRLLPGFTNTQDTQTI